MNFRTGSRPVAYQRSHVLRGSASGTLADLPPAFVPIPQPRSWYGNAYQVWSWSGEIPVVYLHRAYACVRRFGFDSARGTVIYSGSLRRSPLREIGTVVRVPLVDRRSIAEPNLESASRHATFNVIGYPI